MPLLLLLLVELFTPSEIPLEAVLYLEYRPAARVEIFPERPDAAAVDSGVFRIRLQGLGEDGEPSAAANGTEVAGGADTASDDTAGDDTAGTDAASDKSDNADAASGADATPGAGGSDAADSAAGGESATAAENSAAAEDSATAAAADAAPGDAATAFGGDLLSGTTELLVERSRRRGAVYTLFSQEDHPLILDLRQAAARIPHDFLSRHRAAEGESFEIATGDFDVVVEFLPDSTMIAVPAQGMMLIVPHPGE